MTDIKTGLTIQEVAGRTGVSVHTLRYYERIGLLQPIERATNGHRRYTEQDVGGVEFFSRLRATGMPIRQMLEYARLVRAGVGNWPSGWTCWKAINIQSRSKCANWPITSKSSKKRLTFIIRRFKTLMKTRKLGNAGLTVSALGLGCMGMSAFYANYDDQESLKTLDRAVELGVTFWDTSDIYGPHTNEELLGKALKGRRDQIVLATKFGVQPNPDPAKRTINGRPEYVKAACDASLKRLGLDYIDLYYQHRIDPNVPVEETVGAMAELVEAGKVRFLGLSEAAVETIRRAQAVHPITAIQTEYSLWSRDPEDQLLPTLRELGIGFVAYSPLGRGFLTGQIKTPNDLAPDDIRRTMPRFQGENFDKNLQMVNKVNELAAARGATPGQIALAWLLAQGENIVPIPGTKRRSYLEENVAALDLTLTQADLDAIEEIAPHGAAAGTRYAAAAMTLLNK